MRLLAVLVVLCSLLFLAGCQPNQAMPTPAQLQMTTNLVQVGVDTQLKSVKDADRPKVAAEYFSIASIVSQAAKSGSIDSTSFIPLVNTLIGEKTSLSPYVVLADSAVVIWFAPIQVQTQSNNPAMAAYIEAGCLGVEQACQPYMPKPLAALKLKR